MKHLPIETNLLQHQEFAAEEPANRATWFCLLLYCARVENGGKIENCADWPDRKWIALCGVTSEEVKRASALWSWDGDTLIMWNYPKSREEEIAVQRRAGAEGGVISGEMRRAKSAMRDIEKVIEASVTNDPPLPKEQMYAYAQRIGMPDFEGYWTYWQSMNWITAYGGIEHKMLTREISRSMVNWKKFAEEKRNGNGKSANGQGGGIRRPATYLQSPEGKYTADKCGF